jgi:hypothetical protein
VLKIARVLVTGCRGVYKPTINIAAPSQIECRYPPGLLKLLNFQIILKVWKRSKFQTCLRCSTFRTCSKVQEVMLGPTKVIVHPEWVAVLFRHVLRFEISNFKDHANQLLCG